MRRQLHLKVQLFSRDYQHRRFSGLIHDYKHVTCRETSCTDGTRPLQLCCCIRHHHVHAADLTRCFSPSTRLLIRNRGEAFQCASLKTRSRALHLVPDTGISGKDVIFASHNVDGIRQPSPAAEPELHNSSVNDVKKIARDSTASTKQDKLGPSGKLLRIVRRYLPDATPAIQLIQPPADQKHDGQEAQDTCIQVTIASETFGISITKIIDLSEQSQASLEEIFEGLAQRYVSHLTSHMKTANVSDHGSKAYDMNRLYHMLELEPVFINTTSVQLNLVGDNPLELTQAQAYSGLEPVGQPQIWTDAALTKQFARASADFDALKRASQAGIDLDSIKPTTSVEQAGGKKKEKSKNGELPRTQDRQSPRVYEASVSQLCLSMMLDLIRVMRDLGLPDDMPLEAFQDLAPTGQVALSRRTMGLGQDSDYMKRSSAKMKELERERQLPASVKTLREQRLSLPMRQRSTIEHVLNVMNSSDVLVLVSETGSGKTTQLPQILLENAIQRGAGAMCNIICTQPRRIAATSVAARVAQERNTVVGGSVGYRVRFDYKPPSQFGSITYSTAGVLLKSLQTQSDRVLDGVSHIVVDEIHERDLTVDLLLTFLRDLMRKRRARKMSFPKIVLMSATVRSTDFEEYFATEHKDFTPRVAAISVPGRAFPVRKMTLDQIVPELLSKHADDSVMMTLLRESRQYLKWEDTFAEKRQSNNRAQLQSAQAERGKDDEETKEEEDDDDDDDNNNSDDEPFQDVVMPDSLMMATTFHILKTYAEGDILVFLPGMKEIDVLSHKIVTRAPPGLGLDDPEKIRVFKLHSSLHETNSEVFLSVPEGCRRIILATNIAQTSITLPNVSHVIDSGKQRIMAYDQIGRRSDFNSSWIDHSTALQRKGRAGRVQSGHYWAMFTDVRLHALAARAKPEILFSDLATASLILKSHSNDIDIQDFFARTLDPPDRAIVAACVQELCEMGTLTADEKITPLGKFCAEFPLHPTKAKGLLLGILFGCFQPFLILASHDANNPLVYSATSRKDMFHFNLAFANVSDDDRYAFVCAFMEYNRAVHKGMVEEVASLESKMVRPRAYQTMLSVARQISDILGQYELFGPKHRGSRLQSSTSIFKSISNSAGRFMDRIDLFKALALNVMNTNVAVWDEREQSWLAKDVKCLLKPYSVNTMQGLKLLERPTMRQSGELVGYSEMLRNFNAGPRPFLVESSNVTPLMAMLFGGPLTAIDSTTVQIDGWLRYKITAAADGDSEEKPDAAFASPVIIIVEFRKALDRFINLAFSDLRNVSHLTAKQRSNGMYNEMFRPNKLQRKVRQGLLNILESDTHHWSSVLHHDAGRRKMKHVDPGH